MNPDKPSSTNHVGAAELLASLRKYADQSNDAFTLRDAIVEGDLDLRSLTFAPKVAFNRCVFRGKVDASEAHFSKSLTLTGCRFERDLRLFGTRVGGQLLMDGVVIRGVPAEGASLEQLHVAGNLSAAGLDADGKLNFRGARVEGQMDFSGARVAGDLSLQNARLAGNLFLRPHKGKRATITGTAWMFGVQVGDLVDLSGASIGGDLLLEDARLQGGLFCRPQDGQRVEVGGNVWLTGAAVSGSVDLGGAKVAGDVLAESAEIKGGFFCRVEEGQRAEVGGRFWLSAVDIGSQLSLTGAKLAGNVVLQHAEIDGGVQACPQDGFRTEIGGQLWLVGAKVNGGVDLTAVQVSGAVYLQNARIDDLAIRSNEEHRVEFDGLLDAEAAKIGRLELDGRTTADQAVKLSLAEVTHLNLQQSVPKQVELEGFQFQQLTLPKDNYLGWLAASSSFQASTYVFMEDWLRNHGNHSAANRVYLAMRRRDRWEGRKGMLRRLGDGLLDATIGYGIHWYRPLIFYFIPILLLSLLIFRNPQSVHRDVPKYPDATQLATIIPADSDWGLTEAASMALRTNLPMFLLMVDDEWQPSSKAIDCMGIPLGISYAAYAMVVSLLSWIAVPLFVIGMSGILKKEA